MRKEACTTAFNVRKGSTVDKVPSTPRAGFSLHKPLMDKEQV